MTPIKDTLSLWQHPSAREAARLIAGEQPGKLTFNLDQDPADMPVYRTAIYRITSALITLLLLPYALAYAVLGDYTLAIGLGLAALPMGWHCWRLFYANKAGIPPLAVMLGCTVALMFTIYFKHHANIYWTPALLVLQQFVLPRHAASLLGLLTFGMVAPVVMETLPAQQSLVLLLSMFLTGGGAWVFSQLVARQDLLLQRVAVQDPLTLAYNRRYLMESLEQTLELHRRYDKRSSIIMLDIDHFKAVNDELGHGEGDRVLKELVLLLQRRLRRTDRLYRYGGEEFVILLNETDVAQAHQLAREFCALVRGANILPDRRLTVSCGVAGLCKGENTLGWLARCDEALYRAKHAGRNRAELA